MTLSTVKRLTKPLDEPKREFRRRRKPALHSHQNKSLSISGRNLFDDEASSSCKNGAKPPTPPKTLHEHSHPNSSGSHEADECNHTNRAEQVCLSGGDIYDDPSLLRFHQNDDTLPRGNNKRKEKGEDGPEWIIRSKFEDELANFMLEKKSHAKGIEDMLVQHRAENLATDHLSRLENPDLRKLTRVEIMDLFPEEHLIEISDKINEPCVLTESYVDAWPEMRQHKFFDNVTADHPEDIMASPPPQEKSLRLDFNGHVSFAMHVSWSRVAMYVSEQETSHQRMKHFRNTSRIPKALISDMGTHFCNHQMEKEMKRYGVVHRFSTAYHPQTNRQVENINREIKRILKKTIRNSGKDWSYKLDDALWAFRTAFKTPLGTTPFRIIYDKACHLSVKLEHKAYWAIKNCNTELTKSKESRFLQINKLDEMRLDAYESSISYKERTKMWHDKRIKLPINYERGDKVLLFNSRLRLFLEKLKPRWYGPFSVSKDMKNGAIELYDEEGSELIVNKQQVYPYQKNVVDTNRDDDITLEDKEEVT
uniref:Putative reverse transcriptase domain-containing protein n=1 Tax=Tanacetum cinerariifolium TaxID=118510 RepID=A0A6L2LMX1_TANCI|nr:putative reverse transcriptase domain-containing protein [Tanacetum cinerariifolium]